MAQGQGWETILLDLQLKLGSGISCKLSLSCRSVFDCGSGFSRY